MPKIVWLSEDATGILSKVEYDSPNNQLVGLVLPMDRRTGIPKSGTFQVKSFEEMKGHTDSTAKSTLAYIIVAQPIVENTPPFILSIYGTDNKFKAGDVLKRWKFVETELARY